MRCQTHCVHAVAASTHARTRPRFMSAANGVHRCFAGVPDSSFEPGLLLCCAALARQGIRDVPRRAPCAVDGRACGCCSDLSR